MDWVKENLTILAALFGLAGWGYTLQAAVDQVKEAVGPPGSLPVIELRIEQMNERTQRLEKILEKQDDERDKMMDVIRNGQERIDSLIDLLIQRERDGSTPPRRLKPSSPPVSSLWGGLTWS